MAAWFSEPAWLWALLALIPLAWWDLRRRWEAEAGLRPARVLLRVALLASLIVALAGPRVTRPTDETTLVFVVDRSPSIPEATIASALGRVDGLRSDLPAGARTGLVLFDTEAAVAVLPGEPWVRPVVAHREGAGEGTDIAGALGLALGLVPSETGGRVVLLSDGRPTSGDLDAVVARAASRGVAVSTVALEPAAADPAVADVVLEEVEVPAGATLRGTAHVEGGDEPVSGRLVVTVDGEVVHEETLAASAPGPVEVAFEHPLDPGQVTGVLPVAATLFPDGANADPGNDRALAHLVIGPPPRVLVVAGKSEDAEHLVPALEAEGIEVELRMVDDLDDPLPELDEHDVVFLANAPIASPDGATRYVPDAFVDDLRRFVSDGGGLVVLGGDRAYDLGGYQETPLADVLPVEMEPKDKAVDGAVTLIIILDQSGSMAAWTPSGKTKIALADEGAVASMRLLRPVDRLGVMAVDDRVHWTIPVQPVVHRENMEKVILGVEAYGGGIYVYTSLLAAHESLKKADTPLKHVILFCDAADAEELVEGVVLGWGTGPNVYQVAQEMRRDDITISVIGIGTPYDIHADYLTSLANAGGGRYYLTADAEELKSLFIEETERFVDTRLEEDPFRPVAVRPHPLVDGVDLASAPKLKGYVEVEARPTAEVVLEGPGEDPILVTWRYGLGEVVAFSSDASSRWAADWVTWEGYQRFWTQVTRAVMRSHAGHRTAVEVEFDGTEAHVRVARRDEDGLSRDETGLRAVVSPVGPDGPLGAPTPLALEVTEPGLWEATVETDGAHSFRVAVLGAFDEVLAERTFAPPPSEELRHRTADRALLASIAATTGGEAEPARLPPALRTASVGAVTPLGLWFLVLTLLLLPADAWARRPAR